MLFCNVCSVKLSGPTDQQAHNAGRRHKANVAARQVCHLGWYDRLFTFMHYFQASQNRPSGSNTIRPIVNPQHSAARESARPATDISPRPQGCVYIRVYQCYLLTLSQAQCDGFTSTTFCIICPTRSWSNTPTVWSTWWLSPTQVVLLLPLYQQNLMLGYFTLAPAHDRHRHLANPGYNPLEQGPRRGRRSRLIIRRIM